MAPRCSDIVEVPQVQFSSTTPPCSPPPCNKNNKNRNSYDENKPSTTMTPIQNSSCPQEKESKESKESTIESLPECNWLVHPTTLLPILTVIDYFSVALIHPLLPQYFQASGFTSASQRELLTSLYFIAQIIGAIVRRFLSSSNGGGTMLCPRKTLLLSFGGSSLSYFMIIWAKRIEVLVCSRILVGLVKQTVTVGTSLMSQHAIKEERTKYIGRIMSSCTIGFIIGPSVGGYLYKYDIRAPALLASILFIVNFLLAAILIPSSNEKEHGNENAHADMKRKLHTRTNSKLESLRQTIKSSPTKLLTVIASQVLFHFMVRAVSYANMTRYYEEMYQIQPHQRGYILSYQRCWNFTCQTFLVKSCLQYCARIGNDTGDNGKKRKDNTQQKQKHQSQNRGEYNAACIAAFGFVFATLMEYIGSRTTDSTTSSSTSHSYRIFLIVVCPILALSTATMNVSLKSLLTHVAPKESLTSVFGVLDVLTNMASVSVPFYRTCLFRFLGYVGDRYNLNDDNGSNGGEVSAVTMSGDPSSILWLMSSLVHWLFAALVFCYLLIGRDGDEDEYDIHEASTAKLRPSHDESTDSNIADLGGDDKDEMTKKLQ